MEIVLVFLLFTGICQVMSAPTPQSQLEDYLYQYGYLPATDRQNKVARSEADLEQATMRLQKFMGLEVTGKLDEQTLELIGKTRCGMPDMVVKEDEVLGIVEVDDGPANYSLANKWSSMPVTYRIVNRTPDLWGSQVDDTMYYAAKRWSDASWGLTISATSSSSAQIPISFGTRTHGSCPYPFDGPNNVLAHAFYPGSGIGGDMHFDDDEWFTLGAGGWGYDLMCVAVHEFGHSLGIKHSNVYGAIMYPTYSYSSNPQLSFDDIAAIRALYG